MKKFMTVFVLSLFILSFASAITFKQYEEDANLKLPCSYYGANCEASAICTISILYPNNTFMIENQNMTNNGNGMPNITLPNTETIGEYNYKLSCTQSGESASSENTFDITTTGIRANNKIPIFLLIFASLLLIMGFLFRSPPTGFFSGILFVLSGMYLMIYGFGDIADLYTRGFALIVLALGAIMSILAWLSWFDEE